MFGVNLEYVFYGFTLYDLLLSFGRLLIAVSGSLLVVHNVVWLLRGKFMVERRAWRMTRAILEVGVGAALANVYWRQISTVVFSREAEALNANETLAIVWAFAIAVTTLLATALAERR